MANNRNAIVTTAIQGMNGSVHPAALEPSAVVRMVNCQLKGQLITTRPGFRAHKLGPDADRMRRDNIQGAIHYNPVFGQSQQSFGKNRDSIAICSGGRMYNLTFGTSGVVSVSDETGDYTAVKDAHIVWLYQAENYLIRQDGTSNIWIWDGESSAFTSTGYRTDAPEKSRLANGASAGTYAHGRIIQVIFGNRIIVGDIIHKTRLSEPKNILEMTEQVYFATGSFFSPPSNMGEVVAISFLPLSNTQHGHDDVVIHCRRGIYSLKLDHSPRSEWPTQATSKHLLLDTAATGPYGFVLYDGDQMFRSRNGIQTIRSAAANANILGNPNQPISEPVDWLDRDYHGFLKFASMAKWSSKHRIFCTTGLWADGRFRGGNGIVSLNLNPDGSLSPDTRSWEGLWTFHPDHGKPVQLLNAQFDSQDRMFVLSTDPDCDYGYKNNLLECDDSLKYDVMEDGRIERISCQAILKQYPMESIFNAKNFNDGRINFSNVSGLLDWGVWARNADGDEWVEWRKGTFKGAEDCDVANTLSEPKSYRFPVELGSPPEAVRRGFTIQLLVRWKGYASLESAAIGYEEDTSNGRPANDGEKVVETAPCGDYDDYEYTKTINRWETQ